MFIWLLNRFASCVNGDLNCAELVGNVSSRISDPRGRVQNIEFVQRQPQAVQSSLGRHVCLHLDRGVDEEMLTI